MSLSLYCIIFIISASLLLPESVAVEKCTVSIDKNVLKSDNNNSHVQLIFKNMGQNPICFVKFSVLLPKGVIYFY